MYIGYLFGRIDQSGNNNLHLHTSIIGDTISSDDGKRLGQLRATTSPSVEASDQFAEIRHKPEVNDDGESDDSEQKKWK